MIEVFFSKISEVNDLQFIDKSYSMVSENCKSKAKCFRFEADRLRTIIGELLARYGICHCFGIDASNLDLMFQNLVNHILLVFHITSTFHTQVII